MQLSVRKELCVAIDAIALDTEPQRSLRETRLRDSSRGLDVGGNPLLLICGEIETTTLAFSHSAEQLRAKVTSSCRFPNFGEGNGLVAHQAGGSATVNCSLCRTARAGLDRKADRPRQPVRLGI